MTKFLLELRQRLFHPVPIVCWAMASLVASYCGPFGTFNDPLFPDRSVYWSLLIAFSIVVAFSTRIAFEMLFGQWSLVEKELATVLMFSVLFTPVVWHASLNWFADGKDLGISASGLFGFILLISSFVSVLILIFSGADQGVRKSGPALLARLPETESGEILSLWAQDHYVHVITDKGQFPLLMRFADAIAELDGLDGAQVHRSYWVARNAVEGAVRRNGRHFVTLTDGSEVPVSRGYRQNAESAGFI